MPKLLLALALVSCAAASPRPDAAPKAETALKSEAAAAPQKPPSEDVQAFLARVNAELRRQSIRSSVAGWVAATYITDDTERLASNAGEDLLSFLSPTVKEARELQPQAKSFDERRQIELLLLNGGGPTNPADRAELSELGAKLPGLYGKGKWCGADGKATCRNLEDLTTLMSRSRDPKALLDAWVGWHTISKPMRPLYARYVELNNEGARDSGFADVGAQWRAGYDMTPEAFEKETDRLWQQVKPLYDDLHCYVRAQLQKKYGKELVKDGQPIPAHLLGNMWAQEWNNIYPLVEPYHGVPSTDVTPAMEKQGWDWKKMVKTAEGFYTSMGLDPLPETFWERSMFLKPRDREVVCHASAWNPLIDNDLRIKVCLKTTQEDLQTLHHELGHNYYEHYYYKLPQMLYHGGANDGFHEAIGDSLVLSMTPGYLKKLGLLEKLPADDKGTINVQMKDALTRIAFLPFGKLIDQWRWDVYSGKTKPADYNKAWWALREKYQGVAAPVARTEEDFDPGAKYHVASDTPYTRYFLARVLQFQFHRAMCQAAGFKGPLHECSVYGSKAAGDRLKAMLELGQSKPWQDALFAMTGSRDMDASAILDYFAPLQGWLKDQNKGQRCGW
jgi:peptidyl-dipeptidase A